MLYFLIPVESNKFKKVDQLSYLYTLIAQNLQIFVQSYRTKDKNKNLKMLLFIPFRHSGKHRSEDQISLSNTFVVYEHVIHLISPVPCHMGTQVSGKTVGKFYK